MKFINTLLQQTKNILLVSSFALFSMSSYAGNTVVSTFISGNDCDGSEPFAVGDGTGNGFGNCILEMDSIELAATLVKFGGSGDFVEAGQSYSYNANHWDIDANNNDYKTGTWTLQGTGYPEVTFWAAKAGSGMNLYWEVDDSVDCSDLLSFTCMSAARTVTTGTWSTPNNNGGNQANLSHLTFFGGICLQDCEPDNNTEVPEPSTIAIFALALGLLRIQSKRLNA
jgi:hypothetical protein